MPIRRVEPRPETNNQLDDWKYVWARMDLTIICLSRTRTFDRRHADSCEWAIMSEEERRVR